jgi:hypothetical protein
MLRGELAVAFEPNDLRQCGFGWSDRDVAGVVVFPDERVMQAAAGPEIYP